MAHASSDNLYGPPNFIVDANPGKGSHTTIASAIADAVSGQTIFIRPGTYVENIVAKGGVSLVGYRGGNTNNYTQIAGKITINDTTGTDSLCISNISFASSGGSMVVTADNSNSVHTKFYFCNFLANGSNAINDGGNGKRVTFTDCQFNLASAHTFFTKTGNAELGFQRTGLFNDANSTTASTASAGTIQFDNSGSGIPFSTSGTAGMSILYSRFPVSGLNATAITCNGSGSHFANFSEFSSGTASAISIGSGTTLQAVEIAVHSTNTNSITGAGTLAYQNIGTNNGTPAINVTTKTRRSNFLGPISFDEGTNFLSNYEVGTFTPTITGSGSNPTVTYTTNEGYYTRIGNCIFCQMQITINTYSGGSGTARIVGWPYTAANNGVFNVGSVAFNSVNVPTGTISMAAQLQGNTQICFLKSMLDSAAGSFLQVSDFTAGDDFTIGIFYFV